jgi:Family of unknown function (DUF5686)/CarboxypepD_reg-like domain
MRYFYLILFFFTLTINTQAQIIEGQVFDANTKIPIPFATVSIKNTTKGVITDEFGKFKININNNNSILQVTSLGYFAKSIPAQSSTEIYLEEQENLLNEVSIYFVNPAHRIIENTIKNKIFNDPEKLLSFKYNQYNKSVVTALTDSLKYDKKLGKILINNDLYINESISKRSFLRPNLSKEIIEGSKTSGSKTTLFTSLSPLLQQFGFYRDYIQFQGRSIHEMFSLVNPLADGATKRYDFTLSQTIINQAGDSTFVVEFEPNTKSKFSGLKGVLHIHSNDFALQYVEAEPADRGSLHFKLEQYYSLIEGTNQWFPTELNIEWLFSEFKIGGQNIRFNIKSLLSNIEINPRLAVTDFDQEVLVIKQDAIYKNEAYWQSNRPDSLSFREKNTYLYHQQLPISKKIKQNIVLNASEWYTSGMIPIHKKLDLSIQNLFDANIYEGFRPTFNILTNDNFSKLIRLDAKLGYGFKDKALKYEARLRLSFLEKYKGKLNLSYRNDISEPGNVQYFIWNSPQIPYELIRTFQIARADSLNQWKAEINFRAMKYATFSVAITSETRNPTYAYKFHNPMHDPQNEMMDFFHTTELSFGVRYAFGEQFSQIGRGSIITAIPSPTIALNLIEGQMHYPEGNVSYTKLNTKIEYNLKNPSLGDTYINFTASKIFGNLPYPYLYNGRGGKAENGNLIWVANHFNTMGLYEFTSDQYANLFLTHSFGTLLFKPNSHWFQPEVSLFQGLAIGSLSNKSNHEYLNFKTLEKGYFETGLLVDNLYRQKIFKLLHIGAGIGVFNRWGANRLGEKDNNWAYRLVWNVKF